MKLSQLFEELDRSKYTEERLKEVADGIASSCKPYLLEIGDVTKLKLYRGMSEESLSRFNEFRVPTNRAPRDTAPTLHNGIGEIFKRKFGHNFRAHAVFATGDAVTAGQYAESSDSVAIIFPIGEFQYLWSDTVEDMTRDYGGFIQEWRKNIGFERGSKEYEDAIKYGNAPSIKQGYEAYLKVFEEKRIPTYHHNKDLKDGIRSGMEIMIACESYIAIPRFMRIQDGRQDRTFFEKFVRDYLSPLM